MWEEDPVLAASRKDLKHIKKKFKAARCRRGRPVWACPNELWRIALMPREGASEHTRYGVGYDEEVVGGDEGS